MIPSCRGALERSRAQWEHVMADRRSWVATKLGWGTSFGPEVVSICSAKTPGALV